MPSHLLTNISAGTISVRYRRGKLTTYDGRQRDLGTLLNAFGPSFENRPTNESTKNAIDDGSALSAFISCSSNTLVLVGRVRRSRPARSDSNVATKQAEEVRQRVNEQRFL